MNCSKYCQYIKDYSYNPEYNTLTDNMYIKSSVCISYGTKLY